jgi:hypothetical protein
MFEDSISQLKHAPPGSRATQAIIPVRSILRASMPTISRPGQIGWNWRASERYGYWCMKTDACCHQNHLTQRAATQIAAGPRKFRK